MSCGDIPVFMLAIYGKNDKANLAQAEHNELARFLPTLADACRNRKEPEHEFRQRTDPERQ
ncbi:MAG: hypothetical protein EP341_04455 [Sphingomonadales bacterium]|nr:MAG: hypothetical protein EP341_04455 [Sphingomonadales bacterium]